MGLGICEEQVLNTFNSMKYHETALAKAIEGSHAILAKEIAGELVRVYKKIARDFRKENDFEHAMEFYEKCLDACKRASDQSTEAKCYYKLGLIYESRGEVTQAVSYLNEFLSMC